jgi:hypothetical protein
MTSPESTPQTPTPVLDEAMKSQFLVDYYAITARNQRSRFQRRVSLHQILGAQSETAVLRYLQRLHSRCEIMIMRLDFV